MKSYFLIFILLFSVSSCIETTVGNGGNYLSTSDEDNASVSLQDGAVTNEQKQKVLSIVDRERRETNLAEAERNYQLNPDDEENIIWYGRRLAYLGRFQEAIIIYSEGLIKHPESFKLLRHRGHRYLTLRQFDNAIKDLQNAVFYSTNIADEIEEDGIPNSYNRPRSTIKFNIWYHLGLSYYMKGNYDKAVSSFKQCQEVSNNNDLVVRTINWLHISYRKMGNIAVAEELIQTIPSNMRRYIIENENKGYHDLIMLYRKYVTPDILIQRYTSDMLDANIGYGVANFYLQEGQRESTLNIFNKILETDQWDSFGYIAAEAESIKLSTATL